MSLFDRKRLSIASDGAWVGGDKVALFRSDTPPSIYDGEVLVRGLTSDYARDLFAMKARAAPKSDRGPDGALLNSALARHTREVLAEVCILDAKELPFTLEQIKGMVLDPAYENLITACLMACQAVDAMAQESDATEATTGNSLASSSGTPNTGKTRLKTAPR